MNEEDDINIRTYTYICCSNETYTYTCSQNLSHVVSKSPPNNNNKKNVCQMI